MTHEFHTENIIPKGPCIWVFGSMEGGKHNKGSAKIAHVNFRAQYGKSVGPTENAYAIEIQDRHGINHSINQITQSVNDFILYAEARPKTKFFVSRIGFSEGLFDEFMGKLFSQAPINCNLPKAWEVYVNHPCEEVISS